MGRVINQELRTPIVHSSTLWPDNCAGEMLLRESGLHISKSIDISKAAGTYAENILQLTGSVIITNQWAVIESVTTLTNLTNAYATLYDGTNTVNLTADGAVLSGAPVGSYFTKDQVAAQPYSVNLSDQCRMLETLEDRKSGRPFTVTQKNGTNTYIRFHFTTTDNPVVFTVKIHFEYVPINNSTLVFL